MTEDNSLIQNNYKNEISDLKTADELILKNYKALIIVMEKQQNLLDLLQGKISKKDETVTTIPKCDENLCQTICPPNSICLGTCPNFTCECDLEYEMINKSCEKICDQNQCEKSSSCPLNSECINLCDGFECKCDTGYELKLGICEAICDEDQCQTKNTCPINTTCINKCRGKGQNI